MHRLVFLFFFLSGFSSLVFEVLWERQLMQVFGATSFAISTLLTAFMAGLALGSVIGGKLAARLKRPLRVYGLLEGSIGLYGLVVPHLLALLPSLYRAMFQQYLDDFYMFSLLRFLVVFAVLIVPTTLMGATLPIVSQWLSQRERLFQGSIGLLYGVNTLGACAGCFLAGFVLLPRLGLSATNTTFVIVNLALCALVLVTEALVLRHHEAPEGLDAQDAEGEEDDEALLVAAMGKEVWSAPISPRLRRIVLGAFALSGGLSMCYQVLWTRAYVIVLGSSTYSFTIILVSFLTGLSLGSAVISSQLDRLRRPVFWLAVGQLGLCLSATLAFYVLDMLPELLFARLRQAVGDADEIYLYNFMLVGLVVLLPTFLQGMAFPLVVRALVDAREGTGGAVGEVYAFNTAGSIGGSFVAGFVLLPALGLQKAIALVVVLNLLVGVSLLVGELTEHRTRRRVVGGVAVALAALVAFGASPQIDRVRLTRGLFRAYWSRQLFDRDKLRRDKPKLLFYEDGVTATISVERRGKHVTLKANGKAEASDGADMMTQILVGLLPFVIRSANADLPIGQERAVMIGHGSGVTAGGSLQWPLKSLELIEIEGAMVGASRFFDHVNHKPLEDPRTQLIISDGRNYLEYTDGKYDVIVSEPSNPWISGVAAMFTKEHFERARGHLKPGGVFSQWVQIYELSPDNVRAIFATFAEAFPYVRVFSSKPKSTDLILIGSDSPITLPADGFARAWAIPSVRAELSRAGLADPYDLYGLMFMNQAEFDDFIRGAQLNTDDNGLLEFSAPRDVIAYQRSQAFFARIYHDRETHGDARPHLEGWGNGFKWTPERIGRLARGMWRAGKPALAMSTLESVGLHRPEALPEPIAPPHDALEQTLLAHHARNLKLRDLILRLWPYPNSQLAPTIVDALRHDKEALAEQYMESTRRPDKDGYSGEWGMFYTYLLIQGRYYRFAARQIARLEREADPEILSSPIFHALHGKLLEIRMRYAQSFDAYVKAAALL